MSYWRSAGITYVRFSQIAAQITRKCAKGETKAMIERRGRPTTIKVTKWENGKPIKEA
ncbi:unnamed protein product [Toxocara canis]|uniref:ATP synthase subunit epsilon, mitochondrial n=1 Tax=Toxocara canis TaxID=6265 RepID=A0A183VE51_TOXCA|nr:unnamed protein product [Toxocara canis]